MRRLQKPQAGITYWLGSFDYLRLCAFWPSAKGIIISLNIGSTPVPLSLSTVGQFTSVSLSPSSVTVAFKSTGVYKYITYKRTGFTSETLTHSHGPLSARAEAPRPPYLMLGFFLFIQFLFALYCF